MSDDLKETLEKWFTIKVQISQMEQKREKYKERIEKKMQEKNMSSLDYGGYVVKKTNQKREFVTKNNIPLEFWDKYKKTVQFSVFNISKKKI